MKAAPGDLRTIADWSKVFGVEIIDPDGFDRIDPQLYSRLFTSEEFNRCRVNCTQRTVPNEDNIYRMEALDV